MMNNPYNTSGQRDMAQQYLRQQIEQAGPVEQVLMLYDGAIRFLLQAKAAIAKGDIQARCNANRRAMDITAYLLDMVNPTTGGEAGKALFGIYTGILRKMMRIDFDNSEVVCDELVANFRSLKQGISQTLAQQQGQRPGAPQVVASPTSPDGAVSALPRNAVA